MALVNHYGSTEEGVKRVNLPTLPEANFLPDITYPSPLKMGSPELAKYLQEHYPVCATKTVLEWHSSNGILLCKRSNGSVVMWGGNGEGFRVLYNDFTTYHGRGKATTYTELDHPLPK